MADEFQKEPFSPVQSSKIPRYLIVILLFLVVVLLAEAGFYFWTKKKTPEFRVLGEGSRKTLYGKIAKIEGNILTFDSEEKVTVEIADNARFYQQGTEEKTLKKLKKEEIIQSGNIIVAGGLRSSDFADYKAEVFELTKEPKLLWTR